MARIAHTTQIDLRFSDSACELLGFRVSAGPGDLTRKRRMRRGVVAVDAAAEHCDRVTAALESPAMRLAVDAPCEPAHNHDSGRRELARDHAGGLRSVR